MNANSKRAAALAVLALAACDSPLRAREHARYRVTTEMEVLDQRTHTLRHVSSAALEAAGARASIASAEAAAPMFIAASASGAIYHATAGRINGSFVASDGHTHQMSVLYGAGGGPPVAVQNYIDGQIAMISRFSWQRVSGGWMRTRAVLQAVRPNGAAVGLPYTIYGAVTTVATACNKFESASCGQQEMAASNRHAFMRGIYGLLASCTTPLSAQWSNMSWTFCRTEWILYGLSAAGLALAGTALAACPECGATEAAFIGAMAATAASFDKLVGCMVSDPGGGLSGTGGGGSSHFSEMSGGDAPELLLTWTV